MAADNICDVSARCVRYKNFHCTLGEYRMAYMKNKYDKETNPQVKYIIYFFKIEKYWWMYTL